MRSGEPLRGIVVEVGQGAFLDRLSGVLVTGYQSLRIAGDRLVDLIDPFGRVDPPVAKSDEFATGFGVGARVALVVGGDDLGR